ncbi:hypothetical protein ACFQU2_18230 [Siccirubricoccus deserti]|uniref:Uncharacterized protein n=1 Tax=Siccirubricoccus deserti TaxID=2013562 RepID=A0A9X0UGK6_9PROT|nr:hypothetical protein [Siccirubricoccus deserti]MBC4019121.1 hypothetical protein [Siccirubricoccus deserti]
MPTRFHAGDNLALFRDRFGGALRVASRRRDVNRHVDISRACTALNLTIVAGP